MNAKLKTFMMALVILPVALCFTACGGQLDSKATVNVNGNYNQASSKEDFSTYANATTTDTSAISNGYKMSLEMTVNGEFDGQQASMYSNLVMIYKATETKQEISMKLKATTSNNTGSVDVTAYCVNENDSTTVYVNGKMQYGEHNVDGKYRYTGVAADTMAKELFEQADMITLFEVTGDLSGLDIKEVTKATSDSSVKFKLKLNCLDDKTTDLYYVFENDKFVGLQVNNYTTMLDTMSTSMSAGMCAFNDEIDFNTDGYQDFTPTA